MTEARWPVSVKGVVRRDGAVLLARNRRDEWELPGGRLEEGEQPAEALVRELREETGLAVRPGRLLVAEVFEVVPGRRVLILAHRCDLADAADPVLSEEHVAVAFVPEVDLGALVLPAVYRRAIAATW